MYLIDTNIISEARKGRRADPGVLAFFKRCTTRNERVFLSVVTIGELCRGVDLIRHRGDLPQARRLQAWLNTVMVQYQDCILPFDLETAQLWSRLRVPHPENALDKQIAATALMHSLILVTRNMADVERTGVQLLNPFSGNGP